MSRDQSWTGKSVIVTGATAGVGRATVQAFARRGARVGLLAREEQALEETRREVEELGGKALAVPTDVADPGQVEHAAEMIEREFGGIDVWVNNAMTTVFAPVEEINAAEFKRATEVTYLGTVYGTMAALRRMLPVNRGTIVQVGSALAYRAIPLQAPYCGAKHAIRGFTDSLRCELMHDGKNIHVTMVQLPALNTPQFNWCRSRLPNHPQPVPPIFQPEVAAEAIVWSACHRRRELIVGWPAFKAIWGNKFVPGFADWYLSRNGFSSQQTERSVDPHRPDNLYRPVPGAHSAHGMFDRRATSSSPALWAATHPGWLAAAAALAGVLVGGSLAAARE
jgi:NAD(P)-dependent dehydrogenase (short-subunit alcohol dehydrogenase family)